MHKCEAKYASLLLAYLSFRGSGLQQNSECQIQDTTKIGITLCSVANSHFFFPTNARTAGYHNIGSYAMFCLVVMKLCKKQFSKALVPKRLECSKL